MFRLSPTLSQRAFIAARIAEFAAEAAPAQQWLEPFVREHVALPLYLGWTETIAIRPNGDLVTWSTEGEWSGIRPVRDFSWAACAVVRGAERYPELRTLIPVRPPQGAIDCPQCGGRGLAGCGRPDLDCECGNLGWVYGSVPSTGR